MKAKNDDTIVWRAELTPEAKAALEKHIERLGMTQTAVLSRLVEWFSRQPYGIQAATCGFYPRELEADIAKLLLAKL
jgi:hypothetical protein